KRLGNATMSRAGGMCPICGTIMTKSDIQYLGRQGQIGAVLTAVVVDGQHGKEYRLPTKLEREVAGHAKEAVNDVFSELPFGIPSEPITLDAKGNTWCSLYGVDQFHKLFSPRQLLCLGTLCKHTRSLFRKLHLESYSDDWANTITGLLTLA